MRLLATEWWEGMDDDEVARIQLRQDRLCMPFAEFQKRVSATLGRPVYTHEFGSVGRAHLIEELEGKRAAPANPLESLAEAMGDNPKPVAVVVVPEGKKAERAKG